MGSSRKADDVAGVGSCCRDDRFCGRDGGCMYDYGGGNGSVPHHDAQLKQRVNQGGEVKRDARR